MQRTRTLVGLLLTASLSLSACGGQALKLQAGDPAASSEPVASSGVSDPAVPFTSSLPSTVSSPDGTSVEPTLPEQSAAPADASEPPVDAASLPTPEPVVPTPEPAVPTVAPTTNPEFANVQLPKAEDRWRYIQAERTPLPQVTAYTTPSKQILWWYDPNFGQPIALGQIQGDVQVQATFRLRGQEVDALEVPYQLNTSYGISLPSATVNRMKAAGVGEWTETFVFKTDDIQPR